MITATQYKADQKKHCESLHDAALTVAGAAGAKFRGSVPRDSEFLSLLKSLTSKQRDMLSTKSNRALLVAVAQKQSIDAETDVAKYLKKHASEFVSVGDKKIVNKSRHYAKPWKRKSAAMLVAMIDWKPAKKRASKPKSSKTKAAA